MVRAPCCEKMGLKRGPWTAEEDQILVSYIQRCGHGNWRTLPKKAGLLRCGKSCRLRWTNYLRPDIKRGNFTVEEEETIITLHAMFGNRWSAIAANLPGRTDNEIKNVWHTHLKKRVHPSSDALKQTKRKLNSNNNNNNNTLSSEKPPTLLQFNTSGLTTTSSSPQSSTSEFSSSSVTRECNEGFSDEFPELPDLDESFWSEALSVENTNTSMELVVSEAMPSSSLVETASFLQQEDDMDFWLKVLWECGE